MVLSLKDFYYSQYRCHLHNSNIYDFSFNAYHVVFAHFYHCLNSLKNKVLLFQLAYNNLESLGPIPPGVFEHLVDIDLGVNPIGDWSEICHLSKLPK